MFKEWNRFNEPLCPACGEDTLQQVKRHGYRCPCGWSNIVFDTVFNYSKRAITQMFDDEEVVIGQIPELTITIPINKPRTIIVK